MGWNWQRSGNLGTLLSLGMFVAGIAVGVGVFLPLSRGRCMRRYLRLCAKWYGDDPAGYAGCVERAADVCAW
jgi:hypothetical protein